MQDKPLGHVTSRHCKQNLHNIFLHPFLNLNFMNLEIFKSHRNISVSMILLLSISRHAVTVNNEEQLQDENLITDVNKSTEKNLKKISRQQNKTYTELKRYARPWLP